MLLPAPLCCACGLTSSHSAGHAETGAPRLRCWPWPPLPAAQDVCTFIVSIHWRLCCPSVWCWSTFSSSSPLSFATISLISVSLRLFFLFLTLFIWKAPSSSIFLFGRSFFGRTYAPKCRGDNPERTGKKRTDNMGNTCSCLCSWNMFPEQFGENPFWRFWQTCWNGAGLSQV